MLPSALHMGIITFDIETANIIDLGPGQDLDSFGPFDIAVAATHAVGGEERLWMSKSASGVPLPMMAPDAAQELLQYLESMQKLGHMLVAWNGLSFDMRWIGHAARDMPAARRVALKIYDPMFQFFKLKGFPVGLAKVGEGMGIQMKKLMSGADAPKEWLAGNHQLVCDYVIGDVRLTAEIADAIVQAKRISWITQRGTPSSVALPRLRTVEDCMADPMPDQSWMTEPILQERFAGWLGE